MQPDSKIFVTGGTGMVGSAIIRGLIKRGYNNIISSFHLKKPFENNESLKYFKLDFTNQLQTAHFFAHEKPEYVFVASAKVGGIHANNTLRGQFIYENLQIACNIIHYSYLTGVKKLLFLGSSCIYPKECPQPMKEEHLLSSPLEYTNEPYAVAKIAGLRMCESYNLQYGTNYISAMPTNLFGINDNFNLKTCHVLPALLRKFHLAKLLSEGKISEIVRDLQTYPLGYDIDDSIEKTLANIGVSKDSVEIWGSGMARRDLLYVDDMVDALIYLMEKINFQDLITNTSEIRNTHVNIGSGKDISIQELAQLIKEIVGFEGEIVFNKSKPDGMMLKLLDNSMINSLGWYPKTSLEDGIKNVYKWYIIDE
ncbi:MAG: GDP-L-fucose synthase [Thermodesulfovibrionales bacterium]|nr:GDP-L-fucose synthase [Thermodesulfovibrionales bacterium]